MQSNLNIGTVRKNPKHSLRLQDTFTSSESVSSSKPTGSSSLTKSPNSHILSFQKKHENSKCLKMSPVSSHIQPICVDVTESQDRTSLLRNTSYKIQPLRPVRIRQANRFGEKCPAAPSTHACRKPWTVRIHTDTPSLRHGVFDALSMQSCTHKRGLGLMISCLETLVDKKYLQTCPQKPPLSCLHF